MLKEDSVSGSGHQLNNKIQEEGQTIDDFALVSEWSMR